MSRSMPLASTSATTAYHRTFRKSNKVGPNTYQMPPQDGFSVAHFITVTDVERSARFYERVFGGRIMTMGNNEGAPGFIQIANTWLIVYFGGGPTPDKPTVTLSVPTDPDSVSSFMNIRVADIHACYELWRSRGANFSPSQRRSTAKGAVTFAILTATS